MNFKDTSEIKVPEKLIDQIIGQDRAVKIIRNAAKQRRNILLIGTPGTGKSMLAQGMAELMPAEELEDVLMYPNRIDENNPLVRVVKTKVPDDIAKKLKKEKGKEKARDGLQAQALQRGGEVGQGRLIIEQEKMRNRGDRGGISPSLLFLGIAIVLLVALSFSGAMEGKSEWIIAAAILGIFIFAASYLLSSQISRRGTGADGSEPKLVVDNSGKKNAPFVDATGSKAGALFGDVKHDPLQSFAPEGRFYVVQDHKLAPMSFASLWKRMSARYPELIEKKGGYEYMVLPKEEEVYVLSANGDGVMPTRVMSMNRRMYSGRILRISSEEGDISTTPEHKFILPRGEKRAEDLDEGEELLSV